MHMHLAMLDGISTLLAYSWAGQQKWTQWAHKISLHSSNALHHN